MDLEKQTPQEPEKAVNSASASKKPVVVYIMVLFIVAFLLMAVSFFMHQRSNTEVLGELENSVTAMQEVQDMQDKIIQLQESLAERQESLDRLEEQMQSRQADLETAQQEAAALLGLYTLEQQYGTGDYTACQETMASFEQEGLLEVLAELETTEITPPETRYRQLKEAVEARLAEGD